MSTIRHVKDGLSADLCVCACFRTLQLTLVVTPRTSSSGGTGKTFDTTLNIVSALKQRSGTSCTLFGSSGSKVTIDSNAQTAFAVIDGQQYVILNPESTASRERRLAQVPAFVRTSPTKAGRPIPSP
jgi:hypothetical protein